LFFGVLDAALKGRSSTLKRLGSAAGAAIGRGKSKPQRLKPEGNPRLSARLKSCPSLSAQPAFLRRFAAGQPGRLSPHEPV